MFKIKKLNLLKGFTLIEILIVLAITSVLFIFLISFYFQVNKIISEQSTISKMHQETASVMKTIQQDLYNIVTEKWHSGNEIGGTKKIFYSKKNPNSPRRGDAISFLSSKLYNNTMTLSSQVFNVTYFCKYREDADTFSMYRRESIFVDYDSFFEGISIPIANGIHSFYLEFSHNGEDWAKEEWDYELEKKFPYYIAINIEFKKGENNIYKFREIVHPPIFWL